MFDILGLKSFIVSLLAKLEGKIFGTEFKQAAVQAAEYLDAHQHAFPTGDLSDAARDQYIARALFRIWHQFFGGDPSDKARDFFRKHVTDLARPNVIAGMTTAAVCDAVASAQVQALLDLQQQLTQVKVA